MSQNPSKNKSDMFDTSEPEVKDFNWYSPFLGEGEPSQIESLHPGKPLYKAILAVAREVGLEVLKPDAPISAGQDDSVSGRLEPKAEWQTPDFDPATIKRGSKNLPPHKNNRANNNIKARKLAATIRHALLKSYQLDSDSFVFDCWSAACLGLGHFLDKYEGKVSRYGELISIDDLYTDSWLTYRRFFSMRMSSASEFKKRVQNHLKDRITDPWVDLFTSLPEIDSCTFETKHGFDPNRLAEFLTGDEGDLIQDLWRYQFIGAIKRIHNPGCDHDHMLILISPEKGLRKTTFFRTIAKLPSEANGLCRSYLQLRTLKSSKECQEKLRGKIFVNLDECDSAFRGANEDELKESITSTVDNYRVPYETETRDHPRICTFFGTTNTDRLIQSQHGDRRFFPVQVRKEINIDWLRQNWADFWGFYLWCYRQSLKDETVHRNWITKPEQTLLYKLQEGHKELEPWLETLDSLIDVIEKSHDDYAFALSDLLFAIQKETGTAKRYMATSARDWLIRERGFEEGRPVMEDGKQPTKPKLFKRRDKESRPKWLSRETLEGAYQRLLGGR